jgi:hypothetical protein
LTKKRASDSEDVEITWQVNLIKGGEATLSIRSERRRRKKLGRLFYDFDGKNLSGFGGLASIYAFMASGSPNFAACPRRCPEVAARMEGALQSLGERAEPALRGWSDAILTKPN